MVCKKKKKLTEWRFTDDNFFPLEVPASHLPAVLFRYLRFKTYDYSINNRKKKSAGNLGTSRVLIFIR